MLSQWQLTHIVNPDELRPGPHLMRNELPSSSEVMGPFISITKLRSDGRPFWQWVAEDRITGEHVRQLVLKLSNMGAQSIHINTGTHGDAKGNITTLSNVERAEGSFFLQDFDNLRSVPNLSIHMVSSNSPPFTPDRANHVVDAWCFSANTTHDHQKSNTIQYPTIEFDEEMYLYPQLGSGATATVLECPYQGGTCALKLYHPHIVKDHLYKVMAREMKCLPRLIHRNIVRTFAFVLDENGPRGIVMEKLKCTATEAVAAKEMDRAELLRLATDIGRGLAYLHSVGVIHADVKPDNVLVDHDGTAKITDFGTAHMMMHIESIVTSVRGTTLYTAPEYDSPELLTPACDAFSLGMTLWRIYHVHDNHGLGASDKRITKSLELGKRPVISSSACLIGHIIEGLWEQDPTKRKTVQWALEALIDLASKPERVVFLEGESPTDDMLICLLTPVVVAVDVHGKVRITDKSMLVVAERCPLLKEINISETENVTSASLAAIGGRCHQLETALLSSSCAATDEAVRRLALGCPLLAVLEMSGCHNVTDEAVEAVAESCPGLKVLDVSHTYGRVTDRSILRVAQHCRMLKSLNVSYCSRGVTDEGISAVALRCPALQELDVSYTSEVTDASIKAVAANCSYLRSLNVRSTAERVTDAALLEVARNCSQLELLDVAGTTLVTDASIGEIARCCAGSLRTLNVCFTDAVTDEAIAAVAEHCSLLTSLDVSHTNRISDRSMIVVGQKCRSLKFVNVRSTENITDETFTCFFSNECEVRD